MKILVRYLFINLLKPLLYLLLAFTLLFVIADLMNNAEKFFHSGTSAVIMLRYYSLQLPSMIIFIVPICLLLSTLYSLSMLTRHSEIVAMRASGVSIYRIVRPYLFMGVLCFLFTAVVNEYTGPKFAYRAHQLLESQSKNPEDVYLVNIALELPQQGRGWQVSRFDTRTYTMRDITLLQKLPDGRSQQVKARKGQWLDHRWWFEDGSIQHFDSNNLKDGRPETFLTREMRNLSEKPIDFMMELKPEEFRSSMEQWRYIQAHQDLSRESITSDTVGLHHKLTMPFICIIATVIGIPVGAHTGRKGALAGIMMAIGMFFGFYAVQFTMEYLAKQMLVEPWIGAWSSIIIFSILGSIMIHKMR